MHWDDTGRIVKEVWEGSEPNPCSPAEGSGEPHYRFQEESDGKRAAVAMGCSALAPKARVGGVYGELSRGRGTCMAVRRPQINKTDRQ